MSASWCATGSTAAVGGRPAIVRIGQSKRLSPGKHRPRNHTARYPDAVIPPVKRSPTLCASSSDFFSAARTVSCWNLTVAMLDMLDGYVGKGSGSRGARAMRRSQTEGQWLRATKSAGSFFPQRVSRAWRAGRSREIVSQQ